MDSEIEAVEEKLKSLLDQLQADSAVFERLVYKNKNQHRRSSYFQYLLQVRRDLRLLHSAKLEELLGYCFQVMTGKKPKQKVHLLESLKRRKCDDGKHNFMERLLGAARLLSQMVQPMLKAAAEISVLLARSFFMGFSLTILALLARLRVLAQQILLDVVSVFKMVSSLSQKKQSVKITQKGIKVYREFYPANEECTTLECVWNTDKFILLERSNKSAINSREGDNRSNFPMGDSGVRYRSLKSFVGDDEPNSKKANNDYTGTEDPTNIIENRTNSLASPSDDGEQVDNAIKVRDGSGTSETPGQKFTPEGSSLTTSSSSLSSDSLKLKYGMKKVAFVSIKRPAPTTSSSLDLNLIEIEKKSGEQEDKFYNLLTVGTSKIVSSNCRL